LVFVLFSGCQTSEIVFQCALGSGSGSVRNTISIEPRTGAAEWLDGPSQPRIGTVEVTRVRYDVRFPPAGGYPGMELKIDRYDGVTERTFVEEDGTVTMSWSDVSCEERDPKDRM